MLIRKPLRFAAPMKMNESPLHTRGDGHGPGGREQYKSHMVACVQESLALYLYDNAIFLCERLVAEFPLEVRVCLSVSQRKRSTRQHRLCSTSRAARCSQETVYLLATCYHRANHTYRAYHLLKGAGAPFVLTTICCDFAAGWAVLMDPSSSRFSPSCSNSIPLC